MEDKIFEATLDSVGEGIIATDEKGTIIAINPQAEKLTGWKYSDAVGEKIDKVYNAADNNLCNFLVKLEKPKSKKSIIDRETETVLKIKNNDEIPIEQTINFIRDKNKKIKGIVVAFRDAMEKRTKLKEIESLSYCDYLTSLYNRRYMEKIIAQLDNKANLPLGIMFLDVNGLKLTNDIFGHDKGDELLKQVAQILRNICVKKIIICRTGGDEFALIVPKTDEQEMAYLQEKITKTSLKKIDGVIKISLAIGYAIKNNEKENMNEIKAIADSKMYKNKIRTTKTIRKNMIDDIITSVNGKYKQEQIHNERVTKFCEMIASYLQLNKREKEELKTAAILHDIGKIIFPEDLVKKKKLSDKEYALIYRHPEIGYQILKSADEYVALAEYVLYHHERWDGKGYPHGLKGKNIPLPARIIAVADAYEAMTARRVYKAKRTKKEAVSELKREAGKQFDPYIVKVFVELMHKSNV